MIGPQVFLAAPGKDGLSEALLKLAEAAKDSQREKNPQWPTNLKTELPRSLDAQKADAATLSRTGDRGGLRGGVRVFSADW